MVLDRYRKIIFFLILAIVLVVVAVTINLKKNVTEEEIQEVPQETTEQENEKENPVFIQDESPVQTSTTSGTQLYRNEEFGFEFEYPEGWTFDVNSFYSPSSKLNLQGNSSAEDYNFLLPHFLLNVVTPEFAERAFSRDSTATTSNGILGLKYEYLAAGAPRIAVVLPLKEFKVILASSKGKKYEAIFNQILSTFKFIE